MGTFKDFFGALWNNPEVANDIYDKLELKKIEEISLDDIAALESKLESAKGKRAKIVERAKVKYPGRKKQGETNKDEIQVKEESNERDEL